MMTSAVEWFVHRFSYGIDISELPSSTPRRVIIESFYIVSGLDACGTVGLYDFHSTNATA